MKSGNSDIYLNEIPGMSLNINRPANLLQFETILLCCALMPETMWVTEYQNGNNWNVNDLLWPPPAIAGRWGHCVLLLWFRSSFFSFLFSPPNLRRRMADRHQTLPHVRC